MGFDFNAVVKTVTDLFAPSELSFSARPQPARFEDEQAFERSKRWTDNEFPLSFSMPVKSDTVFPLSTFPLRGMDPDSNNMVSANVVFPQPECPNKQMFLISLDVYAISILCFCDSIFTSVRIVVGKIKLLKKYNSY